MGSKMTVIANLGNIQLCMYNWPVLHTLKIIIDIFLQTIRKRSSPQTFYVLNCLSHFFWYVYLIVSILKKISLFFLDFLV